MKQTLTALLVIMLFAACQQNAEEAKTDNEVSTTMNEEGGGDPHVPGIDPYLITETEANNMIQRYHQHLVNQANENLPPGSPKVTFDDIAPNTAFMLDAKMLKDYTELYDLKKLDIYLAMDGADKMTLVYVGATGKDTTVNDSTYTVYREIPYYKQDDPVTPHMLDWARPCPVCEDRIRLHQSPNH